MHVTVTEIGTLSSGSAAAFIAATSLGPYSSSDAGLIWRRLGMMPSAATFTIGSCSTPGGTVLFAGHGGGLIRSLDSGRSWQSMLASSPVTAIAIDRDRSDEPIALIGTASDGIFRSTDGGAQWSGASPGLLDFEILALQLSPTFTTDNTVLAATGSGLYRSRNGGQAWRPMHLPEDECAVLCVAFHSAFDAVPTMWAGTEASGLARSVDGGTTWTFDQMLNRQGVTAVAASGHNPALILIAADSGIHRSLDRGESWTLINPLSDVLCLEIAEQGTGEMLLAGHAKDGILRSMDLGTTWKPAAISPRKLSTD